jgi:hypothetical protein
MEEFPWYPRCHEKRVVALKSFCLTRLGRVWLVGAGNGLLQDCYRLLGEAICPR